MKTLLLIIPILFLLITSCEKTPVPIDEMPTKIDTLKPVANIVDSLKVVLPEDGNALLSNPVLFSDTIQKKLVLLKDSKVFVTFIDEAATYRNTLCWYSYNKLQPPASAADIKGTVLFPNISKTGEGGQLESGFTVQLGTETFPAGTVIGFFLVADGWQDGSINYDNPTYYTDANLNAGGEQRHILFKDTYSHYLVIGFEDYPNDAKDYNDVFFAVSDNNEGFEATSFDLKKVVVK
jgi:hypothetical protein